MKEKTENRHTTVNQQPPYKQPRNKQTQNNNQGKQAKHKKQQKCQKYQRK